MANPPYKVRDMSQTTVSTKYQVVIPKDAREGLSLRPGQRLDVIVKGGIIHLVPVRTLDELQGFVKGIKVGEVRDEEDRY
jgi:AbrB family looped-hinge helix DNA binding protein